jgi:hypothetical protein
MLGRLEEVFDKENWFMLAWDVKSKSIENDSRWWWGWGHMHLLYLAWKLKNVGLPSPVDGSGLSVCQSQQNMTKKCKEGGEVTSDDQKRKGSGNVKCQPMARNGIGGWQQHRTQRKRRVVGRNCARKGAVFGQSHWLLLTFVPNEGVGGMANVFLSYHQPQVKFCEKATSHDLPSLLSCVCEG